MNTTENNKTIADFMGLEKTLFEGYHYKLPNNFELIKYTETTIEGENCVILMEQDYCTIEDLKFYSDWNWLMQVVDKIESIRVEDYRIRVDIFLNSCTIAPVHYENLISVHGNKESKIEVVYNSCVEFIKSYSENK